MGENKRAYLRGVSWKWTRAIEPAPIEFVSLASTAATIALRLCSSAAAGSSCGKDTTSVSRYVPAVGGGAGAVGGGVNHSGTVGGRVGGGAGPAVTGDAVVGDRVVGEVVAASAGVAVAGSGLVVVGPGVIGVCSSRSQVEDHGERTVRRCAVRPNPSCPLPLGHCWDSQTRWAPVSMAID